MAALSPFRIVNDPGAAWSTPDSGQARGFSVIFPALTSTPKMPIFPLAPKRAATDDTGDAERETITLD